MLSPFRSLQAATIVAVAVCLIGPGAFAQTSDTGQQTDQAKATGLWLMTEYPELTEQVGHEARIPVSVRNSNMPLERVELSVDGLPEGWEWKLLGGSNQITAAMVAPDETRDLTLVVTPPKDVKPGTVDFRVLGHAGSENLTLPVSMTLTPAAPAKLVLTPDLPALRGTPTSSFDFQVGIKNDSPDDATVNLVSQAPDGFLVTFKEQYGSQELTSIPVKAGETKQVKVSVKPPRDVAANEYPVVMQAATPKISAQTQLVLQVTGQPELQLAGPGGILSGKATAGKASTFTFNLTNSGSAPARDIRLSASAPSGWKVTFDPETVPGIAPNDQQQVRAEITPSNKAITGDYMVTIRANGGGASDNARVPSDRGDLDGMGYRRPRHHRRRRDGARLLGGALRPAMSATVIEARGLGKSYGRTRAVDDLDLTIEAGEVFGLLGPNGSGKTTTILMLIGLTEPTSGTVRVLGRDPLREPLAVKKRVGYLPDSVGFYDHLSARENLAYAARLLGLRSDEAAGRIDRALEQVRLIDVADRRVSTYSHGMRQRLGLADVLMKNAELAILDEPTSGLDPQSTQELLELIREMAKSGITIVLSSHLLGMVQTICDRVALFNKGRIGLVGRVADLASEVLGGSYVVEIEATGVDVAAALAGLDGVTSVTPIAGGALRADCTRDARARHCPVPGRGGRVRWPG